MSQVATPSNVEPAPEGKSDSDCFKAKGAMIEMPEEREERNRFDVLRNHGTAWQ